MAIRSLDIPIPIRSAAQVDKLRLAGRLLASIMTKCRGACIIGATTADVDAVAAREIRRAGAESLFQWYPEYQPGTGFPACTCISVNDEVVHGIPGDRIIRDGDLLSIDCGLRLGGWCADCAVSIPIGTVAPEVSRLQATTKGILLEAIRLIRPGRRWSDIAHRMQQMAENESIRYGIVREYVGHGIGRKLHEAPKVPGFVSNDYLHEDFRLKAGMVLAIEPMLSLGTGATRVLRDGWTVVTADRSVAAHEEHTVVVTPNGAEILTAPTSTECDSFQTCA